MNVFLFVCSFFLILFTVLFLFISFIEEAKEEDVALFAYVFAVILLVLSILTVINNFKDFEDFWDKKEKEYYIESVCYNYDYDNNTTIFFNENGYYKTEGKYTFNKRYILEMNNNKTDFYQDDYIVDVFESDNTNKVQINENQ